MTNDRMIQTGLIAVFMFLVTGCAGGPEKKTDEQRPETETYPSVRLELVSWHQGPVISSETPGAEDIKHGLEGGTVIRQDGMYHLFTSEQVGDPKWVKMRLGHWTSKDGIDWNRESTLYESSGDYTGEDRRAALWSPMPRFDKEKNNWYMTYVGYATQPDTREQFRTNQRGQIWQAKSLVPGREGIGGPYEDTGIILEPGPESDAWEGLQGTDSFYPFKVKDRWLAFFGSAKTEKLPMSFWGVGLAEAPSLQGPWERLSERNPTDFGVVFSENPIVYHPGDSIFLAVMDAQGDGFGYSVSYNGLDWAPMQNVRCSEISDPWWVEFRTPLCFIEEEDGLFSVFFTGTGKESEYWNHIGEEGWVLDTGFDTMGWLKVKLKAK